MCEADSGRHRKETADGLLWRTVSHSHVPGSLGRLTYMETCGHGGCSEEQLFAHTSVWVGAGQRVLGKDRGETEGQLARGKTREGYKIDRDEEER